MSSTVPGHSGRRRYEVVAVGALMLLATLYFSYATLWSYVWQSRAHSSFVPVSATVVEASVQSRGSAATTHGETFLPAIVYRYQIAGTEYESRRYFFTGRGWSDHSSAQAVTARFRAGSTIQAYVDAGNPSYAVLDRRQAEPGILLYAAAFVLLALGVVVYGLRKRR